MSNSLEGMSYAAIEQALSAAGVNPVHAKPLFGNIQRHLVGAALSDAEGILPPVQRWLQSGQAPSSCQLEAVDHTPSADGFTEKSLLRLADGAEVEAVRMGFPGRFTACLSSQVGCAMWAVFSHGR